MDYVYKYRCNFISDRSDNHSAMEKKNAEGLGDEGGGGARRRENFKSMQTNSHAARQWNNLFEDTQGKGKKCMYSLNIQQGTTFTYKVFISITFLCFYLSTPLFFLLGSSFCLHTRIHPYCISTAMTTTTTRAIRSVQKCSVHFHYNVYNMLISWL